MIETTWISGFVGHRRVCKMHCKSTKKDLLLVHMNLEKAKEGYVQVFMMLRTAFILLRLWIYFISFNFGDDNISLDKKSYEIRGFLLEWSYIYNFLQYLSDKGVCKHRNISLCTILLIEHLAKTTKYLSSQEDQVSLMVQAILLKYNSCKIQWYISNGEPPLC